MFVIIEGLDRSGKSTLANSIKNKLDYFEIIHCSKPKTDDPYQEYLEMFQKYDGKDVIFDRFYLGEYVYSNLYRGGCKITPFQFWTLDMLAQRNAACLIYSKTSPEVILKRCIDTNEGKDVFDFEKDIDKASNLFDEIIKSSCLSESCCEQYDSSFHTQDEFVEYTISYIKHRREKQLNYCFNDSFFIGNLQADIMVVGEKISNTATTNFPFFSGPSSEYLFDCIRNIDQLRDAYFTNAIKPWKRDHVQCLIDEINLIGPEKIVCLGKESEDLVRKALEKIKYSKDQIKISRIPHPSFWRRFRYNKKDEYTSIIIKELSV